MENQETIIDITKINDQELGNTFYRLALNKQIIETQLAVLFAELQRREELKNNKPQPIVPVKLPKLKKVNYNELTEVTASGFVSP